MLAHRLLAEGALRTQVRDPNCFFQPAAGRDDFPKHRGDPFGGKNACLRYNSFQYFGFALRPVGRGALFQRADLLRQAGAALDQRGELVVERIDLAAQLVDLVRH
jgi:hypothetical protein